MKCHDPDCTKDHAPRTRALTPADHFVFDESASVLKLCYGGGPAPHVQVDCIMHDQLQPTHYVARQPQLCYELNRESSFTKPS